MKQLIYSLIIISSLLTIHCSNEIPVTNDPINLELGKVSLRIDKENAPQNVVLVEAFLTREGQDTLYGSLNIITSTSADILFQNLNAGEWHLKVDAKDSSSTVVYTGETEINVHAAILTIVNLTLVPTGLGTGSIYIYVTWGQSNLWIDYPENPVLSNQNTYYDQYGIAQTAIIRENNLFKMWYVGEAGSGVKYVLYAESEDGIDWTHPHSGPVLSPGPQGTWDSWAVHPGAVIKDEGIYKMYYSGWASQYAEWHVGLATSSDGTNWVKNPTPILFGGVVNEYQIVATCVIKINETYYMYYSSRSDYDNWKINIATSADGINWNRYSGNPVLISTEIWEGNGVYHPSVIVDNGIFRMVYMGVNATTFGLATSSDALNWTPLDSNPFFTTENTFNHWAFDIAYPNFVRTINNELRIYYSGIPHNSYRYNIGFMKRIP